MNIQLPSQLLTEARVFAKLSASRDYSALLRGKNFESLSPFHTNLTCALLINVLCKDLDITFSCLSKQDCYVYASICYTMVSSLSLLAALFASFFLKHSCSKPGKVKKVNIDEQKLNAVCLQEKQEKSCYKANQERREACLDTHSLALNGFSESGNECRLVE